MVSWESHMKDCEAQAVGQWLLATIGQSMGLSEKECELHRIQKALYKGTACGAYVNFDEAGVIVGTIVEGSDAELSMRIPFDLDEPEKLVKDFWSAVEKCEYFAKAEWAEANLGELDDE